MKIAILHFGHTTNHQPLLQAIARAEMGTELILWQKADDKLAEFDGFVITSHEDFPRSGVIAAKTKLMQHLIAQSEQGKPILGIASGAQILIESGLVPGVHQNQLAMALTANKQQLESDSWVYVRLPTDYQRNAFTRYLNAESILHMPISASEAKCVMSDVMFHEIKTHGLNVFEYCNVQGETLDTDIINPTGSQQNIAAISNKAGNVLAILPDIHRTENSDGIFHSMRETIARGHVENIASLNYVPRVNVLADCEGKVNGYFYEEAADEQVQAVQTTLNQLGFPVNIKRYRYASSEHEAAVSPDTFKQKNALCILVRAKDDLANASLWQISSDEMNVADYLTEILATHVLHNPYAEDCCRY